LIRNRKLHVLEVFWDSGQYMAQACVYSCRQYLLCCWLRRIRWIAYNACDTFLAVPGVNNILWRRGNQSTRHTVNWSHYIFLP